MSSSTRCATKGCEKPAVGRMSWLAGGERQSIGYLCADCNRRLWERLQAFPAAVSAVIIDPALPEGESA